MGTPPTPRLERVRGSLDHLSKTSTHRKNGEGSRIRTQVGAAEALEVEAAVEAVLSVEKNDPDNIQRHYR